MNKKKNIIGLIILLFVLLIPILFFIGNHFKEIKKQEQEQKKIELYKEQLSNKYKISKEQLELLKFDPEHKEKRQSGPLFDMYEITVPDFIKFKYKDKVITIYEGQDDYYYDELIDALKAYYSNQLNIDNRKILVEVEETAYCNFFGENNIDIINEEIVKKFINSYWITLVIQNDNSDVETGTKEIINKLNNLDKKVNVQVMRDISTVKAYRKQPNYNNFDYYYVDIDYKYRVARITPEKQTNYKYYNNYYYS